MALVLSSVAASANTTHRISKGDTLWDIAKKYKTTPIAIAQANGISENATLALGKVLKIPSKSTPSKATSTKKPVAPAKAPAQISAKAEAGAASATEKGLIEYALSCRGVRYSRGGVSRSGFDCSGFTRYVFAKYGISLPHSSAAQARLGKPVAKGELQPGDLVFFETYRRGVSHVGIYTGNNQFVHAATRGSGVRIDSLGSSYYAPRYRGARRVN